MGLALFEAFQFTIIAFMETTKVEREQRLKRMGVNRALMRVNAPMRIAMSRQQLAIGHWKNLRLSN